MHSTFVPDGSDAVTQAQLDNPEDLWHLLRELQPGDGSPPPAVEIVNDDGASLVWANTKTGIVLMLAPDDSASYHAKSGGQPGVDEDKTVSFTYMGSFTEVPASCAISEASARLVVEAFFCGGSESAFRVADWESD